MRLFYIILSCCLIALGAWWVVQGLLDWDTAGPFAAFSALGAMAGLAVVLTGALNLLNQTYGSLAYGVRASAIGANLALIAFQIAFAERSSWSDWGLLVILLLLALLTLLSFSRRSLRVASRSA